MEKRKRKRGEVTVHEYLRFIDSFKFMPCSLEKLVETLEKLVEKIKRKRGEVTVHEYLRFIDSFKFMPCSLEKLVETLLKRS